MKGIISKMGSEKVKGEELLSVLGSIGSILQGLEGKSLLAWGGGRGA